MQKIQALEKLSLLGKSPPLTTHKSEFHYQVEKIHVKSDPRPVLLPSEMLVGRGPLYIKISSFNFTEMLIRLLLTNT